MLKLKDKKILILGFGREGQDTLKFLVRLYKLNKWPIPKALAIADKTDFDNLSLKQKRLLEQFSNYKLKLYFGENYLKGLKSFDLIIKTPGIPLSTIRPFLNKKQKVTSQTEIFFDNCPGTIIGITGTKGKSTTTSIIYQILKNNNLKAHLVGNIGKPVLNFLFSATAKDIYVYELSCHQLNNLKKSPHISVFLNIYPEHLDYYKNIKEYVKAKSSIALYQKKEDYLIYNKENEFVKEVAKKSKANKIEIVGDYLELNKAAARAVAKILDVPNIIIEESIRTFKPLDHRLELVGTFKGITFYNDALATIPEATIAAINTLGDRVETILLGGFDRNIDFKNLAEKILDSNIRNIILFPTTGKKIWETILELQEKGIVRQTVEDTRFNRFFVDDMKSAVKLAYKYTKKGNICLLSTASASFGIFKDYKEKGDSFKKQVILQQKR